MSLSSRVEIPPSDDPDRFEEMVAALVERDRTGPREPRFGRQDRPEGVDVCFESADGDALYWLLCLDDRSLAPLEDALDALAGTDRDREVEEVVVATTAPRDGRLAERVRELEAREAEGEPSVRLLARDDVTHLLAEHEEVLAEYYPERYRDRRTTRETGFVRLTDAYLDGRPTAPPEVGWRTGFTLAEVREGHAFERWHDDDGALVSDDLLDRLGDGESHVLLGPPGSGKSTLCKSVACEWHDRDRGTVFYRRGEARNRFDPDDASALGDRVDRADGHVLVVVEDATDPDAVGVADLRDRFRDSPEVTFLLDARTREWRDAGEPALDSRRSPVTDAGLREYEVPRVTADECGALLDHFEAQVGADLDLSGGRLHADLSAERVTFADRDRSVGVEVSTPSRPSAGSGGLSPRVGEPLLLAYRLLAAADIAAADAGPLDENGRDADDGLSRDLKASVVGAYRNVASRADGADGGSERGDVYRKVGLLASALSAAGVPVTPELVHALGEDADDHRRIAEALDALEGRLVFPEEGGYRSRHGQWAELYLELAADRLGDRAVGLFEDCVNAVFALADSPERREALAERFDRETPLLDAVDADPRSMGDALVERVFAVGLRRPTLAPLFGTTERSGIEVPTACSPTTAVDCTNWRGQMSLDRGEFESATREFERLGTLVESLDALDGDRADEVRAWQFNNLGNVARSRGDLDAAEDYYLRAIDLLYDLHDDRQQATTVSNLGSVTEASGDLDAAETYYQRSLDLSCDLSDERGRARSLNDLGNVAQARGDYDTAADYYRRSFTTLRDLGDEHGTATTLNNLGNVARARGDYATAADYYQRSYAALLHLVDGREQAQSLGNLGVVARSRGDLDAASDYYRRSLNLVRDLGDEHGEATSLNNLGNVARSRGDLDDAEEYYRRSLEIKRKLDDRRGEATSLNNLGNVAQARGELDDAEEYYRRSLELKRDLGDDHGEATSRNNLGLVARERGDYESARDHFEAAADALVEAGTIDETLTVLDNAIDACRRVGDAEAAIDHCETALELAADADVRDRRREFRRTYATLPGRDPAESTLELYRLAFTHVLDTEPMAAILRFAEAWERRPELDPDSAAYATALDAGVYLAAHFHLLDGGDPADELPDPDDVLDAVADERDRLSAAVEPLFEHLADGETATTPTDLYKRADAVGADGTAAEGTAGRAAGIGEADDELARREARTAAILLENLD